jgi:hypothetical protein
MRLVLFFNFVIVFLLASFGTNAAVNPSVYGISIKPAAIELKNKKYLDSTIECSLRLKEKRTAIFISKPFFRKNLTVDFYLLLLLIGIFGALKASHPKFFNDIWKAFINPTLGSRQLKELIQSASLPNLIMNLLSSIILGTYLYYIISTNVDWRFSSIPNGLAIGLIIIGTVSMYAIKYLLIQFAGWVFHIQTSTEQYNFNVFLINKIMGIALIPFLICFAFLNIKWKAYLVFASIVLVSILMINRYIRSWGIFSPFFQNSHFHFFMYLCAFELLPLAVLLKLVFLIL